jgi:N-acetylglucosaminyldiphosphoundecaprenol N-acetyl-beta-D-mannosaminyltransferase
VNAVQRLLQNFGAVEVFGLRVDRLDLSGLLRLTESAVDANDRRTVMYLNVNVANRAYRDADLRSALEAADWVYCDGEGVRIGARILGEKLPERMTGADLVWDVAELAARRGFRVFWVGGARGVAERAAEKLVERFPGLRIAGVHHGFFVKEGVESRDVIGRINSARPDILMVGLGTPLQELWASRNRGDLDVPVVWCIGAAADFVAGVLPRGPEWMVRSGLEWMHRFWVEPRRLFVRYVVGNPLFLWRVLLERLRGPAG